jgi:serine/threonine-protein kinase RsbW
MDWYLASGGPDERARLSEVLVDHLARRIPGMPDSAGAGVAEILAGAIPDGSRAWVDLSCDQAQPVLVVRTTAPAPGAWSPPGEPVSPGVWEVHRHRGELKAAFGAALEAAAHLEVLRPPEADIDVGPVRLDTRVTAEDFVGAVAAALPFEMDRGLTALEAATACGVAGAGIAAASGGRSAHAGEIASDFAGFGCRCGGQFEVLESDSTRAVLANHRCPFGANVIGHPAMCRVTSGTLGSMAALRSGSAAVVVDEAIAMGDPQCRLTLDLDPGAASPVAHHYHWPPAGASGQEVLGLRPGFRLGLSLQLPRDRLSVPIVRHLVTHAMSEVGAAAADAEDVELAVSEACGNVIEHSAQGDAYEVLVTIGPVLAEIRVVDVGRGFDHASLSRRFSDTGEERGRGVALMHALVDQVRFESAPERGTVVHLVKQLHFDESSPARRLMRSQLESEPPGPS